ncbi:MAG: hypothetical protein ACYSWW_10930 [Planctomycetota bacterium]|jgi:hypothetical protein
MKPADEIRQLFRNGELGIDLDADEKVFADVSQARQETTENAPAVPEIWRIIMKSPLAKVAAAAVLIVACLIGVFMFNRTSSVAWALEQSIEALSKYNAVVFEGSESDLNRAEHRGT